MTSSLEFSQAQLCELWLQHTSLEDDPRDANNDLRVTFEDAELRQELTVEPATEDEQRVASTLSLARRATFERVRAFDEAAWSSWARIA